MTRRRQPVFPLIGLLVQLRFTGALTGGITALQARPDPARAISYQS